MLRRTLVRGDREFRLLSKYAFPNFYGGKFPVTKPHKRYLTTIRSPIGYCNWVRLDVASFGLMPSESTEPETDNPKAALESLVEVVETESGADARREFAKVGTILLKAIKTPKVA